MQVKTPQKPELANRKAYYPVADAEAAGRALMERQKGERGSRWSKNGANGGSGSWNTSSGEHPSYIWSNAWIGGILCFLAVSITDLSLH